MLRHSLLPSAVLMAGAFAAAASAAPSPSHPAMSERQVAAALTARLDSLARVGAYSGAVLLAKGDRVLVRKAVGLADRRFGVPNRADTKFNLGSINKTFTSIAIRQLAAAGKLSLDDTIDRFLPEVPPDAARRITIRMLLDHEGGVPDFFGPNYRAANHAAFRKLEDWLPLFVNEPLRFEPGTRQEYSNGGYLLLGLIIERASGESYYDYVREHVYRPAGMRETDSYPVDDPTPNLATGYAEGLGKGPDGRVPTNVATLPGRGSSAGGGYSTVDDLFRFARALRAGTFGPREGGMGVAGGSPGTNAVLEMEGDWTIIALANLDPPAAESLGETVRGWLGLGGDEGPGGKRVVVGAGRGSAARATHAGSDPDTLDEGQRAPKSTSLPAEPVDAPLRFTGRLPVVDVMVNGKGPFHFGLDTGAAGTVHLDSTFAARLGLPVVGHTQIGDPSGRNQRDVPLMEVASLEIGGARFAGLTAPVRSYSAMSHGEPIDGILGFRLFADCLVTLDWPNGRLRIEKGSLPPENGRDVIAFHDERGIPSFTMRVAGHDVDADLDAGSMGGIILPDSMATALPLASEPRVVGHARTVSNSFDIKAADLDGDVSVGSLTFHRPTVEFQPLFPMANLGSRMLRDLRVTFDQKGKRMRIERPS
ncbi:MAG TPA: serine hydrolase [Candidatus Eisenbacteria bacterium]